MSHVRKQVRDYVVNLLKTTGYTVYPVRKLPVNKLPVIGVYTATENILEDEGKLALLQHRDIELTVISAVEGGVIEDTIDNMTSSIESKIMSDIFLGGLVYCVDLVQTNTSVDDSGEAEIGLIMMTFSVKCLTENGEPETLMKG
jgi:hypothetical protein